MIDIGFLSENTGCTRLQKRFSNSLRICNIFLFLKFHFLLFHLYLLIFLFHCNLNNTIMIICIFKRNDWTNSVFGTNQIQNEKNCTHLIYGEIKLICRKMFEWISGDFRFFSLNLWIGNAEQKALKNSSSLAYKNN